jgi:D-glycero-D-manno-heptose 1,7-bisphosphate phosphatase
LLFGIGFDAMSGVKKIAFLDRDGVVNIDHGYVFRIDDFQFTDCFFPACALLAQAGYSFAIVTNQSGIARGYYSEADFSVVSDWLKQQFVLHGLVLEAIYHCPHGTDAACACRKPLPGMVNAHLALTGATPHDCIMFGDKASDEACAVAAGLGHFFMVDVAANPASFYDSVTQHLQRQAFSGLANKLISARP